MAHIVEVAGVAVSTVSRALSGANGVSAHKRAEIQRIARELGYDKAMTTAGLTPRHINVAHTASPGRKAAERILVDDTLPEGIICFSDEIAADLITTLRESGIKIPTDISVIGVDDHPIAHIMGITTINQPAREQGRQAALLARRILENPNATQAITPTELPVHLVIRNTTQPRQG